MHRLIGRAKMHIRDARRTARDTSSINTLRVLENDVDELAGRLKDTLRMHLCTAHSDQMATALRYALG